MTSKRTYFPPFSTEPGSSGFVSTAGANTDQEYSSFLPPLPQPTPTDFSNLFIQDGERINARRHKPGHIPRPRNAFILFRCDFIQQRVPEDLINDHRDLSRLAGCVWRKMSDAQKRPWFEKAEVERRYHSEVFPEYRYSPTAPDRPKRVYRKKKPFVSEEILLKYPHRYSEPPLSTTRPSSPQVLTASLASRTQLPSSIVLVDPRTSTPHKLSEMPQSYPGYQHDPPMLQCYQAVGLGWVRAPSPGVYCGGFANVCRHSPESVSDWEPSHPESSAYYDRGYWQTSETPESAQGAIASGNREQALMNPSLREPGPLYDMWRELGTFHDQAFNPESSPDLSSNLHYSYIENSEAYSPSHQASLPLLPVGVVYNHFPIRDPLARSP